jgi:hypothetical protein
MRFLPGIIIAFLILSGCPVFSQGLRGSVINAVDRSPVAFAVITYGEGFSKGLVADINGRFELPEDKNKRIRCSFIGYESREMVIRQTDTLLIIALQPRLVELGELVVRPGENPALRIIRSSIRNKKLNDPERLKGFRCREYSKLTCRLLLPDTISDSLILELKNFLPGGYAGIMESVIEHTYTFPEKHERRVLTAKASGFRHPSFAPTATRFQPFSFYGENLRLFDRTYISPLSDGATGKYLFTLTDTIFKGEDTVFVITFRPLPKKSVELLEGVLYINSNRYAVENVIAAPSEKGIVNIHLQQLYRFTDGRWIPEQLHFTVRFEKYPLPYIGMMIDVRSNISSFTGSVTVKRAESRSQWSGRSEAMLSRYRPDSLTAQEKRTYVLIDSLGRKWSFDKMLKVMEKLADNRIPASFLDIRIRETLIRDRFEGFRAGLALETNEKVSRFFSVGGFYGKGLKDRLEKYGANLRLDIRKEQEFYFNIHYRYDVAEPGRSTLWSTGKLLRLRDFMTYRKDRLTEWGFTLGFRAPEYLSTEISLMRISRYDMWSGRADTGPYNLKELRVKLRYAPGEMFSEKLGKKVALASDKPVFCLSYTQGLRSLFNVNINPGDLSYHKIEISAEKTWDVFTHAKARFRAEGGYLYGELPHFNLFTGKGAYDPMLIFFLPSYFQTMDLYEFTARSYLNLFGTYQLSSYLFRIGKLSRPSLRLAHGIMIAGGAQSPEKPYNETGILLPGLLKINFVNLGYLNLGPGLFYRHNYQRSAEFADNIFLKIAVDFSTN